MFLFDCKISKNYNCNFQIGQVSSYYCSRFNSMSKEICTFKKIIVQTINHEIQYSAFFYFKL